RQSAQERGHSSQRRQPPQGASQQGTGLGEIRRAVILSGSRRRGRSLGSRKSSCSNHATEFGSLTSRSPQLPVFSSMSWLTNPSIFNGARNDRFHCSLHILVTG